MTKIFLLKLLIFILPIILAIFLIESILRNSPSNYKIKIKSLQELAEKYEVIVFGNSHAFLGINPIYIKKSTYNMANYSENVNAHTEIFNKYFFLMKKLNTVILNISYFTFETFAEDFPDDERAYYYYYYYKINEVDLLSRLFNFNYYLEFFALGLAKSKKILNQKTNVSNKDGFLESESLKQRNHLSLVYGFNRLKNHQQYMSISNVNRNLELYSNLINSLKAQGKKVIMLRLPVHQNYRKFISTASLENFDKAINFLKNNTLEYYDFFNDNRFSDEDFLDVDHLNSSGAKKFSLILNSEILNNY